MAKGLDGAKPVDRIAQVIGAQKKRERHIWEKSRRAQGHDAVSALAAPSREPVSPNGRATSARKPGQLQDDYGSASRRKSSQKVF